MSPLDLLNELPIPAYARKWIIYFLIPVAVFVFGVWQASDGDWKVFWTSLVTLGMGAIAHAFTTVGAGTSGPTEYEVTDEVSGNPDPVNSTDDTNMDSGSDHDASDIYGDGADRGADAAPSLGQTAQAEQPATPTDTAQ